jgi:hypothetical protein
MVWAKHWHLEMHSEYCALPFTHFNLLCRMNKRNIWRQGGSVSQDTNLKKDMCLCTRPSTNVLCTVCGYITVGRIRRSCPQHSMVSVRYKFFFWLESLSDRIKLIKKKGLCVDWCLVYLKHCWLTLCLKDGWLFCPNSCTMSLRYFGILLSYCGLSLAKGCILYVDIHQRRFKIKIFSVTTLQQQGLSDI